MVRMFKSLCIHTEYIYIYYVGAFLLVKRRKDDTVCIKHKQAYYRMLTWETVTRLDLYIKLFQGDKSSFISLVASPRRK